MARITFTALLASIAVVSARRTCGNTPSDSTVLKMETSFKTGVHLALTTPWRSLTLVSQNLRAKASGKFAGPAAKATPVIKTYFHVITTSTSNSTSSEYLSRQTIQAQMDVLNQAYTNSGTSLSLNLVDIDRNLTPRGSNLQ